ncbi:MAG: signal peptidase I [Actinomycetia bacterium]|nr:signal peptidase I [Actinomycetes bacterium]
MNKPKHIRETAEPLSEQVQSADGAVQQPLSELAEQPLAEAVSDAPAASRGEAAGGSATSRAAAAELTATSHPDSTAADPDLATRGANVRRPVAKPTINPMLRQVLSFVGTVALVFVVVTAVKLFVFDIYAVPTGSMVPTIEIDDHVLAEKVTIHFTPIQPGDIVTFHDPLYNPNTDPASADRILIKRVIAVGGQTVRLLDGHVFVNNIQLDEPYTHGQASDPLTPAPGVTIEYPYTVPEGMIWVMGDNRTYSADSRYFGAISEDAVTGRGLLVVWPFSRFGPLK